ncbi:MAG: DUF3224 domain-containing protein [Isosphaeraceae bacterium]
MPTAATRRRQFGVMNQGTREAVKFENGVAKESYLVIPGSGTGELRGLRGEGTSAVGHGSWSKERTSPPRRKERQENRPTGS